MTKKLAIVLLFIVLLPLIGIGVLSLKITRDDSRLIAQQYQTNMESELQNANSTLENVLQERTAAFEQLCLSAPNSVDALRDHADETPFVRQFFMLNRAGQLVWPLQSSTITATEDAFFTRTAHLWRHRHPFRSDDESTPLRGSGFHSYYWQRGLHLIYWCTTKDGKVAGFDVETTRLVSDLVAALPQTPLDAPPSRLIRLVSENGDTVYQFGGFAPAKNTTPRATLSLPSPFASWHLAYFAPKPKGATALTRQTITTLLLIGTLLLLAMALLSYFVVASGRERKLALQQVNFVNQVSHELKTPLTNIRMYAELLADRLDEEDEVSSRYLNNITTESRRLTRLIQNVLSFARSNNNKLVLRPANGIVDDVIIDTVDSFRPSLARLGIELELQLDAGDTVLFDGDVAGQVLTNLIGNVEKYAREGRWMRIESALLETDVRIRVRDRGPGIPHGREKTIFAPFSRIHNQITEGATGTGIGLTIARNLARLHEGDLTVLPSAEGAVFEFRFKVKRVNQ
ncbi:MAG: HAMP domain-containing histidine kinase [Deltaproteobacteria bacterium]|nr:HAMP domain-containing histidine kinase [Deltaproteobacteria bacterium]